ncbi:MAG: GNAT family N-acetyltransferase [SAR202 cluster bacterium]|nr:GNAT family N-acetyltransferase [SAR202 cluster bacterium]
MSNSLRSHVRTAQITDLELFWRWANDPVTRWNSFSPNEISLKEHSEWFRRTIASPSSRIYVVELDDEPVGQVRFDKVSSDEAEIDVYIAPEHRGRGLGTLALRLTREMARKDLGIAGVIGIVKTSNPASCAAFQKADFVESEGRIVKGHECRVFLWPPS